MQQVVEPSHSFSTTPEPHEKVCKYHLRQQGLSPLAQELNIPVRQRSASPPATAGGDRYSTGKSSLELPAPPTTGNSSA